ncbi:MAG: SCO family protein [Ardenticatenales bacterium]
MPSFYTGGRDRRCPMRAGALESAVERAATDGRAAVKEQGMAVEESIPPTHAAHPEHAPPARRRMSTGRRMMVLAVAVAALYGALFIAYVRLNATPDGGRRVTLFAPTDGVGFKGIALPEPFAAPALDLATADGGRFRLADARGKAVLVYFGYTRCPDVCPQTLARLTAALATLGADADRVAVAFVTIDPLNDRADVVRGYLADYDPRIVGLVGAPDELAAVAAAFDIASRAVPTPAAGLMPPGQMAPGQMAPGQMAHEAHDMSAHAGDPAMATPSLAHSSSVILIDPAGLIRAVLPPEQTPGDIAHDVSWALANR